MGTFLEWMLESTLLVLMVLAIRKVFMGKVHYAAIYSLWIVVLLRLMIPFNLFSTPVSVENLLQHSLSAWNHAEAAGRWNRSGADIAWKSGDGVVSGDGAENVSSDPAGLQTAANASGRRGISGSGNLTGSDSVMKGTDTVLFRWYPLWHYGRLVVAALVLFCFLFSNASLLRIIRKERLYFGQRGKIKIYTVSNLQTPCLYGFLEPAIYLPASLADRDSAGRASAEELEQMITHEYTHYCHRDHIWAMLRMLAVSFHWYNPFVWLAASCSKKDAELFCDETVIHRLGEENRFRYGRMLVRLAGNSKWGDFRYSMMLMSRRGREMEQRIRAISGKRRYSRWMFLPLAAALAVAVAVTCSSGIPALAGKDSVPEAEASEQTDQIQAQDIVEPVQDLAQHADSYEEAFDRYIRVFTDAVNTGDIGKLNQVLLPGSEVYEQQCSIVQNYHKRGIREEIITYSIPSATRRTADCIGIDSSEEILVHYRDNSSKVVKQKYRYTCEYDGQGWIITGMQEIK